MTSSAYNPLRSSAPPEYKSGHDNVVLLRAELKATVDERDMLLCELEHLRSRMDNGRQLSASGPVSRRDQSYDWLKSQCDEVMDELHMLQQQHSDMVQNFVKARDNNEHLSVVVSSLRMQLDESNAEKMHLHGENKSLRARLDEIERSDKAKALHRSSVQEKDTAAREAAHGRLSGHGMDGSEHPSQPHHTVSVMKSDIAQQKDHITGSAGSDRSAGEMNTIAARTGKASLVEELRSMSVVKSRLEVQLAAAIAGRTKDTQDIARLRAERNNAVSEYNLVMSERDSVLRESERLRSTISDLELKVEAAERNRKAAIEEAERARVEFEAGRLQAEALASSLSMDSSYLTEIDHLRRDLDKMQAELLDAVQELEESKRQREWAFGERDKIVLERDNVRILCDQLCHERDGAVSDLFSALRDSDDIRRQKNDAIRELKEFRERYEALIDKEIGCGDISVTGHHQSRDSAIDTEVQECEMEICEIDLGTVESDEVGFDLVSGSTDLGSSNGSLVFVKYIQPNSSAYGKLRTCDQILRINSIDVSHADKATILHLLRSATKPLRLVVCRRKPLGSYVMLPMHVRIVRRDHQDVVGISLEEGIFVSSIEPSSAVGADETVTVGDRLLSVNGVSINGKSVGEIQQLLNDSQNHLILEVMRCRRITPMSSDLSQSSPFPTPSSPLTADEFDPPSMSDESSTRENQTALLHTDAPDVRRKSDILPAEHVNISEPDIMSSKNSCSQLGRSKENKPNFLDKAVSAITRPFLRSRQLRATRDARSKSAFVYVSNSDTVADDFVISGVCQNVSAAVGSYRPDSATHKEQSRSLAKPKPNGSGHGTWPKYRARAAQRPSVLPVYGVKPSSSGDDESPLLPKQPVHRGIDIRCSESARHRPQISDSVVDYVRHVDSSCSGQQSSSATEDVPKSSSLYKNSCTVDSVIPLGPHYAKQFPDQTNETTVTVRSRVPAEHHVTVISHFPVEHCDSEMASYGGHTKYTQRPIPHISSFSSAGQNVTENKLLHSSGVILSSPPSIPQQLNVASSSGYLTPVSDHRVLTPSMSNSPFTDAQGQSVSLYSHQPSSTVQWMPRASAAEHSAGWLYSSQLSQRPGLEHGIDGCTFASTAYPNLPHSSSPNTDVLFSQLATNGQSRIRIPSSASRGTSPISQRILTSPTSLHFGPGTSLSLPSQCRHRKERTKPPMGCTRMITAELQSRPFGIDIETSQTSGGIFVSMVEPGSVAAQSGVMVGDQLLDVCGINMRNATKQLAASVLRQCSGTISILLQYNPNKFIDVSRSRTLPVVSVGDNRHAGYNKSATYKAMQNQNLRQNLAGPTSRSHHSMSAANNTPRFVARKKLHPNDSVGLTLVGGNAVGIFVRDVMPGSLLDGANGMHCGDQILQFNGVSFLRLTLEQAMLEVMKPCDEVRCCVQYNIIKYNSTLISKRGGDSFYMRAVSDYTGDASSPLPPGELNFARGDVLFVDSTVHAGHTGVWHAWQLDAYGSCTGTHGILPSLARVEDEGSRRRSTCDITDSSATASLAADFNKIAGVRNSGSFRRSLFRRRRHRRSDQRESVGGSATSAAGQMHPSHSDASINSGGSGLTADDGSVLNLERVEKLDNSILRPVLLIAPFASSLIAKLTAESPDKFCSLDFDSSKLSDSHHRSSTFHCDSAVDVEQVRSLVSRSHHCLLDASPDAVDQLHRAHVYPIVLFIKHKSAKQIREMKDSQFLPEKVSSKVAKELFERFQEYECIYQKVFAEIIPGGSLAFMCCKIKPVIDREQKKVVWVPASSAL